jgi:hypothetical protein
VCPLGVLIVRQETAIGHQGGGKAMCRAPRRSDNAARPGEVRSFARTEAKEARGSSPRAALHKRAFASRAVRFLQAECV